MPIVVSVLLSLRSLVRSRAALHLAGALALRSIIAARDPKTACALVGHLLQLPTRSLSPGRDSPLRICSCGSSSPAILNATSGRAARTRLTHQVGRAFRFVEWRLPRSRTHSASSTVRFSVVYHHSTGWFGSQRKFLRRTGIMISCGGRVRQRERVTSNRGSAALDSKVGAGLSRNRMSAVHQSTARPHTVGETLLDLQRTHGNAFVQRLVQRKLAVSRPGDSDERTADRVVDAVIRERNASGSVPSITRYEQPGVHRVCPECEAEIEHREVAGKQAVQEEALQAMPRPEMKTEVARVNQVRLSTRSVGATPAVISRQDTSPEETAGKQRGAGGTPRDIKKLLKDPCFGERVDDTKAHCQFSSKQSIMIRLVKESALRACTGAIAAIGMPGNEERVKQIARDYFHLDIKLSEKTKRTLIKTIKSVSAALEHAAIECRTCHDEGCNRGLIAFVESRTVLALCPPFFDSDIHKVYLTPRYLIHEAGHLAGVNTPTRDEMSLPPGGNEGRQVPRCGCHSQRGCMVSLH